MRTTPCSLLVTRVFDSGINKTTLLNSHYDTRASNKLPTATRLIDNDKNGSFE